MVTYLSAKIGSFRQFDENAIGHDVYSTNGPYILHYLLLKQIGMTVMKNATKEHWRRETLYKNYRHEGIKIFSGNQAVLKAIKAHSLN